MVSVAEAFRRWAGIDLTAATDDPRSQFVNLSDVDTKPANWDITARPPIWRKLSSPNRSALIAAVAGIPGTPQPSPVQGCQLARSATRSGATRYSVTGWLRSKASATM